MTVNVDSILGIIYGRGWGRRENCWIKKYLTSFWLGSGKILPKKGWVQKMCLSTIIDLECTSDIKRAIYLTLNT